MSLDVEKGASYYQAIVDNVKAYYMSKGLSEGEALKIAEKTATKLLVRNVGKNWASKILLYVKRRRR